MYDQRVKAAVAKSNYRQVRVTFTQEWGGRLSCSFYGKGVGDQWNEHSCIDRWTVEYPWPIVTADDAVEAVVVALCERRLPGI